MSTIGTLQIEMMANIVRLQRDMEQAKRVVGETAIKMASDMDAMRKSMESTAVRVGSDMAAMRRSIEEASAAARPALNLVSIGILGVSAALASLPRTAFDYTKQLETSALGMAGIMASVSSLNGAQLQYNQALGISQGMIRQLGDDALRTAASSQELVGAFQALLAPGLAAGMKLDEIRQLTVVGTNAVRSMGLQSHQVVQELRDLVAGGITASSSTLATALGWKDSDIAKAKASSEGLFIFLMNGLRGVEQASNEFAKTLEGRLSALKEGATRVAADGMQPLTAAISTTVGQMADLLVTFDQAGKAQINPEIVNSLRGVSESLVSIMQVGQGAASAIWDNRDAVTLLAGSWAALKVGGIAAGLTAATQATLAGAQASRLAAVEAAAESAGNQAATLTSREKTAALLAELQAQVSLMQSSSAAAAAEVARLTATQEGIVAARAQSVADLQATRSTMAQAEAQIAAARSAGALSFALAMVREGTVALTAAQARQAALISELAMLGRQQAGVQASLAAATAAQAAASDAASVAASRLSAATSAASMSSRMMSGALAMMGGPIGVTVTAVAGLAMWFGSLAGKVEDARLAVLKYNRAKDAAQGGKPAEQGDVMAMQQRLDQLRRQRDEMLTSGRSLTTVIDIKDGQNMAVNLDGLGKLIRQTEVDIQGVEQANAGAAASTENLNMTLAGSMQAWKKANEGIKTASSVQADYQQKVSASRFAYERYMTLLQKSGADETAITAAKLQQGQAERALAKERDDALKGLNGARSSSVKLVDAELAGLKAKLDAERQYGEQLATTGLKAKEWTEGQKQAAKLAYEVAQGDAAAARSHDTKAAAQWKVTRAELENRRVVAEALGQQQAGNAAREEALKTLNQQASKASEAAVALEADNAAWGKSKTAIEAAALAVLQLKKAGLTGNETQAYREELDRAIAAQQRWVDALGQADYKKQSQAIEEWNRAATEQAALYQDELQLSGMTALEQAKITAQRATRLKLAKAEAEIDRQIFSDNPYEDYGKKQELIRQARAAAEIESSAAVAKVVQEDWRKTSDKISDSLTDALMRGFESGKRFGQNLIDTLKNMFGTLVLRPVIQAIVQPVAGAVLGSLGMSGTAQAGGSALGTASNLSSLYSAYQASGNLAGYLSGGSAVASVGGMLGSSSMSLFGTGMQLGPGASGAVSAYSAAGMTAEASALQAGAAIGPYASALGGAMVGVMAGKMISGGYSVIGKSGNTAVALGTAAGAAIGSVIPVIGTAIGAVIGGAIGGTVNRAFGMGAKKVQGTGISGTFSDSGASVSQYSDWTQKGGWFRSNKSGTNYSAVSNELDQYLDTALQGVTAANKAYAASLGLSADAVNGFSQSIKVNLQGLDEAGQQKAIADAVGNFGQAMVDSAWGSAIAAYQRTSETSIQTLARLSTSLASVNQIFDTLGHTAYTAYTASLAGADMAQQLIDVFGGLDKLQGATSSYYQNYYTEQERATTVLRQVHSSLSAVNLVMPTTTAEFRALVEAQDLSTAAGRGNFATLMQLSPAFHDATTAMDAYTKSLRDQATSLDEYIAKLKGGTAGLATPAQQLASLRGSYITDLSAARAGDATALGRITTSAQSYIDAQKAVTASSSLTQAVIDQIVAELGGLKLGLNTQIATAIPQFASGGYHDGGWAIVGENGPELANFNAPAQIYNASQTSRMLSNDEVVQELRALRRDFTDLRAQQGEETRALINSNASIQAQAADRVVRGVASAGERQSWASNSRPVIA